MKPIKFRVWVEYELEGKEYKTMCGTEDWFLLTQTGKVMTYNPTGYLNSNAENEYKKIVIMFYTGLNDKGGQEVFNGDIVEDAVGYKCIVVEDPLTCGYYLRSDDLITELPAVQEMRVIGNIYENPELLMDE